MILPRRQDRAVQMSTLTKDGRMIKGCGRPGKNTRVGDNITTRKILQVGTQGAIIITLVVIKIYEIIWISVLILNGIETIVKDLNMDWKIVVLKGVWKAGSIQVDIPTVWNDLVLKEQGIAIISDLNQFSFWSFTISENWLSLNTKALLKGNFFLLLFQTKLVWRVIEVNLMIAYRNFPYLKFNILLILPSTINMQWIYWSVVIIWKAD